MPPRFYCPDLSTPQLDADELHHLHAVRRLGPGDQVELFDGRGSLALCRLAAIAKRSADFEILDRSSAAPPLCRLTVATAIPKGPRMDFLVEKLTELAVAAVWPLAADRSSVTECGHEKQASWHRRAIEAAKQSRLLWLPEIAPPMDLAAALSRVVSNPSPAPGGMAAAVCRHEIGTDNRPTGAAVNPSPLGEDGPSGPGEGLRPSTSRSPLILLADPAPDSASLFSLLSAAPPAETIFAFIGPEGGFTDAERAALLSAGARPVRLAPTILRIETAALALAAVIAARM